MTGVISSLRDAQSSISYRISTLSAWVFAAIVLLITIAKTGLNFTPHPEEGVARDIWPEPTGHGGGNSYGFRALIIYLDLQGYRQLALLGIILTTVFVVLVVVSLFALFKADVRKLGLLLVLSSPIVIICFSYIGRYDILVFIGAWLIAISCTRQIPTSLAALGIVVMISGNPEHALVSAFVLLLASFHPLLRPFRMRALATLITSTVIVTATSMWAGSLGAPTRFTYWPQYLEASWNAFFKATPIVLYSGYGILWSIVIMTIVVASRGQRMWLLLAFIAIPVAIVATTVDQTRVFVGVTALPMLALIIAWLLELQAASLSREQTSRVLLFACAISLLLPSIEYTQSQVVRNPYEWFLYLQSVGLQFF